MDKGKKSGTQAVREFKESMVMTGLLLVVQMVLGFVGFGGLAFVAGLYLAATVVSIIFTITPEGIQQRDEKLITLEYVIRAGMNFMMMLAGLILWFATGFFQGLDVTFTSTKEPDKVVGHILSGSFLLKVVYAAISHLSLFSFCRFCVNIYEVFGVWMDGGGSGTSRKSK